MDKYHINDEGNPGKCSAKVKCPFGGDDAHYFSKEAAQKAFEEATKSEALKAWKKKAKPAAVETETPDAGSTHGVGAAPPYAPNGYGFHGATVAPSAPAKPAAANYGHGSPGVRGHGAAPLPPSRPVKAKYSPPGHGNLGGRGGHGY